MTSVPKEFDIIRTGKGYTMKGWDFTVAEIQEALKTDRMLNPAFELASNVCPWDCYFCFTEDPSNPEGLKKKLENEMTLDERLNLIDQAKALGARSINIVGAGEPTIDPNFFTIVEHMAKLGITPIIYTEGALRLMDPKFSQRLYETGATVVLKVNSLINESYQNAVVNSGDRRAQPLKINYLHARNKALEILMQTGFNKHDPTRLAFDTIICRENYAEIPEIHRFARDRNIFVLFVNYLPSGRSSKPFENAVSKQEQFKIFEEMGKIDSIEYGLPQHSTTFPYAGGVPCSIRGLGLFVKIKGDALYCPGENDPIGNVRQQSLRELWDKAKITRLSFDGGCAPRDTFWTAQEKKKVSSYKLLAKFEEK